MLAVGGVRRGGRRRPALLRRAAATRSCIFRRSTAARAVFGAVDGTTQIAEAPQEQHALWSRRVHFSEVPSRQGRRLLQRGATAATPPRHAPRRRGVCHHASLPAAKYALTPAMVRRHTAPPNTLIVTFANPQHGAFALNWARLLDGLGLPSLVGTAARLDVERELRAAGAGVFCADGPLMQANGQAGRWAEVAPLLGYGVDVLLSDADVAWIRNPLPYFAAARRAHPAADLLMLTDRAFNNYATAPLPAAAARRPRAAAAAGPATEAAAAKARASLAGDLDLEDAYDSSISYNIGVIYMYAGSHHQRTGAGANPNANASLASLFEAWVGAVRDDEHKGAGGLSVWDQAPINDRVLKRGMGRHPTDPALVSIFGGRLAMGVLPMLQFTTSFTYFIHRARRESLGCRPYALHAIFAHGKDEPRKRMIFREEMLWHDPPEYYNTGSFLSYEPDAPPPHLQKEGGFELIVHQLRTFQSALALAAALGRALVLPSLRCGAAPMAYPCYAWYHRAYAHFGFNLGKTPMPEVCPIYYWFDAGGAERDGLAIREPSFLRNPRTPANVSHDVATLTLCARRNETGCRGGAPSSRRAVVAPARTSAAALRAALRAAGAASARVLSVRGMRLLQLSDAEGGETSGAADEGKARQAGGGQVLARQLVHRLRGDAEGGVGGRPQPHDRPRARALLPRRGAAEARLSEGAPILGGGDLLQRHPRRLPAVRAARRDRECERDGLVCAAVAPRVGEPGAARGAAVDPRQVPLRPPAVQRERPQAVAVR